MKINSNNNLRANILLLCITLFLCILIGELLLRSLKQPSNNNRNENGETIYWGLYISNFSTNNDFGEPGLTFITNSIIRNDHVSFDCILGDCDNTCTDGAIIEDTGNGGDVCGEDGVDCVQDCRGYGCCSIFLIGNGVCDMDYYSIHDQYWNCDLSCYDYDGGDCYTPSNNFMPIIFNEAGLQRTLYVQNSNIQGGIEGIITTSGEEIESIEDITLYYENNIDADPLLIQNGVFGDYLLSENSPCIDTGLDYFEYEDEVIVDISEYNGCAPDMGAIESPYSTIGCEPAFDLGDFNADGQIDVLDVVALVANILSAGEYNPAGDLIQDGALDVLDIVALVNIILGGG